MNMMYVVGDYSYKQIKKLRQVRSEFEEKYTKYIYEIGYLYARIIDNIAMIDAINKEFAEKYCKNNKITLKNFMKLLYLSELDKKYASDPKRNN